MPSTVHPGAPGAPGLPAQPAVVAGGIQVAMQIGPQGYQVSAHWSFGPSSRTLRGGWEASPAEAWAALGPRIAPYLNGSALSHVSETSAE